LEVSKFETKRQWVEKECIINKLDHNNWDSASGPMLLKGAPLSQDILKIRAGGISQIWREAKVHAAGIKRFQVLVEAKQDSVGLEDGEAARFEVWILVNGDLIKAEQFRMLDEYLKEKVKEVSKMEKLFTMKGVGLSTVIGFITEVGDIGCFTGPRQIQKLTGLEIVKKVLAERKTSQESARGAEENYAEQCTNLQEH